jgi:MtN3 and saliva related transmembrane protein
MTDEPVMGVVGYVAATFTTVAFVPQLVRVIRLRSTRDISLGTYSTFSAGKALWFTYGFLMHSTPMILANGITCVLSTSILALKIRNDHLGKKEVVTV